MTPKMYEEPDHVSFMEAQLVIRSILNIFPGKILPKTTVLPRNLLDPKNLYDLFRYK